MHLDNERKKFVIRTAEIKFERWILREAEYGKKLTVI